MTSLPLSAVLPASPPLPYHHRHGQSTLGTEQHIDRTLLLLPGHARRHLGRDD